MTNHPPLGLVDVFAATLPALKFSPGVHVNYAETVLPMRDAKYVWFQCAEGYSNTIDMPTALHPQTQLTLKFDHQILPRAYGFPIKIRIPTKLGFKNPKYVTAMWVQNNDAGGYWENQGYNWFSGL